MEVYSSVLHALPIHMSPDNQIKTDISNSKLQHIPQIKSKLKVLFELKDVAKKIKWYWWNLFDTSSNPFLMKTEKGYWLNNIYQ